MDEYTKTKVLITVMTYPHPSQKYRETVCTAGITQQGEWVRLYPVDQRYLPAHQRLKKYTWIEVGLAPRGSGNDNRKESRRPNLDSIRRLDWIPPDDGWRERRRVIDRLPVYTRNQLDFLYTEQGVSLAVVKPSEVLRLEVEPTEREWSPKQQAVLDQFELFSEPPKRLQKVPYKFSYVFRCEDSEKEHRALILDWELGVLFLKEVERLGSEEAAIESVRHNYFLQMCAATRETLFFMGTRFPYNVWMVIGVFWPPKNLQGELDFAGTMAAQ